MRIAVTGAGGFIGANLVRRLIAEGHDVCAILRPGGSAALVPAEVMQTAWVDVTDRSGLTPVLCRFRPEAVYHLASTVWDGRTAASAHEETIVGGMANLLAACERAGPRRLIAAGSAAEYGSGTGFDEDAPCQPETALGRAKLQACRMALEGASRMGLECVWLRLFTPYGPFEMPGRLVPSAIRAALGQDALWLRSPRQERDFVAVADVVEAMARAAWAPLPGAVILNLSSGEPTSAASLANLVYQCAGAEPAWRVTETPEAPMGGETLARSSGLNRRARQWLGWSPRLDLEAGIGQAIAWWKEQFS